jgi:hypothetical protein
MIFSHPSFNISVYKSLPKLRTANNGFLTRARTASIFHQRSKIDAEIGTCGEYTEMKFPLIHAKSDSIPPVPISLLDEGRSS